MSGNMGHGSVFYVPLANSYFVKNSETVSTYYVGLVWVKSLGIHFFFKGTSQEEKKLACICWILFPHYY